MDTKATIKAVLRWILEMILIIAVVVLIRFYVVSPFAVEGSSMEPNFHNGNLILVDKVARHLENIERGDVVVFSPPSGGVTQATGLLCMGRKALAPFVGWSQAEACQIPTRYVKRVIGVGGDTVRIQGGNVWVAPAGENELPVNQAFLDTENQNHTCFHPNCTSGIDERGQTYEVPEGHYFVLGDNRRGSSDSRSFIVSGEKSPFVPLSNIVGEAQLVFWPPTSWGGGREFEIIKTAE